MTEQVIDADEASAVFVRERALAAVVSNLTPAPFVLLPFTALIAALLRADVSVGRLVWWTLVAVFTTVILLLALYRFHYNARSASGGPTRLL
ncbi:MAG: hypothetical protein HY826_05635, partial [Actinobacteria bacterium]|nr:hypothetical protein [Actinomycetota bacterium]